VNGTHTLVLSVKKVAQVKIHPYLVAVYGVRSTSRLHALDNGKTDVDDNPANPSTSTRHGSACHAGALSKMTDALSCLSSFEKQTFRWVVRTAFRDYRKLCAR
jgi:hypothetical protein